MYFSNKYKGLKDIGSKMSMVLDTKKSSFGSFGFGFVFGWFIMRLYYYKMRETLLQNATAVL